MKHLEIKDEKQVLHIQLNRPEKHNAFNPDMILELTEVFDGLQHRENIRAVCLSGAGKSFCAGGDLQWMKSMAEFSQDENLDDAGRLFDMFEAMAACPVPLLGRVHGNVYGGGLGLVAVCDVVSAESKTQFCFSEAKIGIAPAVITPFVLRKANHGLVREHLLTAKVFSASAAEKCGLVHFVGSAEDLKMHLNATLESLYACGIEAIRESKKLLGFLGKNSWDAYRNRCVHLIAELRAGEEGQEGLKAFLEKRSPNWKVLKN